ncbi:MAG: DUF1320 domain-containing protein [Magnetococcales bacterium]|nr:DUF1320 domain-containing protein [Magnetococcales bacterium]
MYITVSDLIRWFGAREVAEIASADRGPVITEARLLTPDGDPEAETAAGRIRDAIAHASRIADSYLSRKHTLPLETDAVAESPLPRYCGDICRFLLWDDKPTDAVRARHDQAVKWLEAVAAGKATLGCVALPLPAAASGAGSPGFVAGVRHFGPEAMRGF